MGQTAHLRDASVPYSRAVSGFLIVNPRSGVLRTPIRFRVEPRALRVLVPDGRA
jgi:hypothetical protein